jgi:hypothetical protein
MSPLSYRSLEFMAVLTWGFVTGRPPVHTGELQPELQPRGRLWARLLGRANLQAMVLQEHVAAPPPRPHSPTHAWCCAALHKIFVGAHCTADRRDRTGSAHRVEGSR